MSDQESFGAFLTGSHAYGTPTAASDIDLCVYMDMCDANKLANLADSADGSRGDSLSFGKLNVLLFFEEWEFRAWKEATEILKGRKPVTRDEAIKEIDKQLAKARDDEDEQP